MFSATFRALLLGFILLLAIAAPASATSFREERPARNAMLDAIVAKVGIPFWTARGVTPCATPEILLAPDLGDHGGYADGCRIWIRTGLLHDAQRRPRSWEPYLCLMVVHELGHTAGLAHSETGVMAEQSSDVPYACVSWARHRRQTRVAAARKGTRAA